CSALLRARWPTAWRCRSPIRATSSPRAATRYISNYASAFTAAWWSRWWRHAGRPREMVRRHEVAHRIEGLGPRADSRAARALAALGALRRGQSHVAAGHGDLRRLVRQPRGRHLAAPPAGDALAPDARL